MLIEAEIGFKCDESIIRDNAKAIEKTTFGSTGDFKLYAGTTVLGRCGKMIVDQVGQNTTASKLFATHSVDGTRRPCDLSQKLITFSYACFKAAIITAALATGLLFLRFCVEVYVIERNVFAMRHIQPFVSFLITGYFLIIVALPFTIPFSVAVAQYVGIKRLTGFEILARHTDRSDTLGCVGIACTTKAIANSIAEKLTQTGIRVEIFEPNSEGEAASQTVQELTSQDFVVAVIGQDQQSCDAFQTSDVGVICKNKFQNNWSNSADLLITNENETDLVKKISNAISIGRSVCDNIRKFIQFQSTLILVVVAFSSLNIVTWSFPVFKSYFVSCWLSLTSGIFAITFAIDPPPGSDLTRRRETKYTDGFVSGFMLKHILAHALYQILVLVMIIVFSEEPYEMGTRTLNCFYIMTLGNAICCKCTQGQTNVLKGILVNKGFCVAWIFCLLIEMVIVQFGGSVFGYFWAPLSLGWWLVSVAFGIGSVLLNLILSIIPPLGMNQMDNSLLWSSCMKYDS